MASTTNFGWATPDDTDLVKDGALAIRTLGNNIDTSLVDLKGGTTGQILSKNSNTDLDYTWINNDQGDITAVTAGTGISGGGTTGAVTITNDMATTITAKGDIVAGTGNATYDNLAVGNSGDTLVADSSQTTGLRWGNNYGFTAGKNKIINGDFRINQRAFTSNTTEGSFNFDRWVQFNGGTSGTLTITPQTFTAGTAPVAGYEGVNFIRNVTAAGANVDTYAILSQKIEDVRTLAGQTATISFWAKAASGTPSIGIEFAQGFGSGGSAQVNTAGGAIAITTSWARYSATVSVPSISGKTIGTGSSLNINFWLSAGSNSATRASSIGLQNNTFDIWGVQVEAGSVATAFQTATGTLAGELAACERYFQAVTGQMCSGSNTTTVYAGVNFRTQMRTAPTVGLSGAMTITDAGADYTQSSANVAIQSSRANERGAQITMANFASITVHRPYSTTITSAQIQFSAEL